MRGRQTTAAADSSVIAAQRPGSTRHADICEASMRAIVPATPPPRPQTTKAPTATRATSLTTASTAMAITMPVWRSLASRRRVPKMTVNSARPPATASAVPTEVARA